MKKIALTFVLLLTVTTVGAKIYHYDVNKDGTVSVSDVTFLVNKILGTPNVEEEGQNYVYDVNGDDVVNITDVTCLVNKILGILNSGEDLPSYLTCPDDHHPHLIDLGLPSGTKWACCNVDTEDPGKQCPSYHGGYYAWGETEVKEEYSWSTYAYGKRPSDCIDLGYDIARTQYDVAHVKWGGSWMMPSFDQMKELGNNCTYTRTSMDGVDGALFTGPSGAMIFLPAAGYYWYDELMDAGDYGYYWSSTQNPSEAYGAYTLYFGSGSAYWNGSYSRNYGQAVRPVCPINLLLSTTSLHLVPNAVGMVEITSGSGSYDVESSAPDITTSTLEGAQVTVTATGLGQAVVTVTDVLSGLKATVEVTVDDNLSLSTTSLHIAPDAVGTVEITSGSGNYDVESSTHGVATATLEGSQVIVTATGLGQAVVTVTDMWTGQKAIIEVTVVGLDGCPDANHPHLIDLGLPSGTKWACCNVDTQQPWKQSPCNNGGYYAWGETEVQENDSYTWDSYAYGRSEKDCDDLGSDIAGTQYDVAHVKWGGFWVMPSSALFEELVNNCTYKWTSMNGVKGGLYTGPSGSTIFLPAAGFRWNDEQLADNSGEYWSSTQYSSNLCNAFYFILSNNGSGLNAFIMYRDFGFTVRPVCSNLSPSTTSLHLAPDAVGTVEITSGSGNYDVESSTHGVATATLEGSQVIVAAKGFGHAVITVTDMVSGQKATIDVAVVGLDGCPDANHPHLIDLGLSSGTKWACCNVDTQQPWNQSPSNYGGYYAWGETEVQEDGSYDNASYAYGSSDSEGIESNISGLKYDVAHAKWGGFWVMPSYTFVEELLNECTYIWTSINGVDGGLFTGPSGGTIFLPAAGYYSENNLRNVGSRGYYWSSTRYPSSSNYAYFLGFHSDGAGWGDYGRCSGLTVRPVCPAILSLSTTSLRLAPDATGTVDITSGSGYYGVVSSDPSVVKVNLEGAQVKVTAMGLGKAVVTVTDKETRKTSYVEVIVVALDGCPDVYHPHMIDLGLPSGTKWACCNVDTESPWKQSPCNYGGYYAWGETEVQKSGAYDWDSYAYGSSTHNCKNIGSYIAGTWDIAGTRYDVAHVKWGGSWVMPSQVEFCELLENCDNKWITLGGVYGMIFTSKKNGVTIFLPAAGYRGKGRLHRDGALGYYWASTQHPDFFFNAYDLKFVLRMFEISVDCDDYSYRHYGHTVRPVFK